MNAIDETKKRLEIVKIIVEEIKSSVKAISLGGSMGYGQNFSVSKDSDIDMLVVCDIQKIDELLSKEYFKNQNLSEPLLLYKLKKINVFWVTQIINEIEVNMFIYEPKAYIDFCTFKNDIISYKKGNPSITGRGYSFNGTLLEFNQEVKKTINGYIYKKPSLIKGKFWDAVPRFDFIFSQRILYDPEKLIEDAGSKFWRETVKLLIKEYGQNPDLNIVGPLHAHWIYKNTPNRLPAGFKEKVIEKTKREIEAYLETQI